MKPKHPPRALVVEDSRIARKLLVGILAGLGFQTHEADDGLTGQDSLLTEDAFDLVTIDVYMPNMDGLELLAWMRSQPQFASVTAMIVTSSHDTSVIEQALSLGADELIMKPYDSDIVVSKLALAGFTQDSSGTCSARCEVRL